MSNDLSGFESVKKRQKYYEVDQSKPSLSHTAPVKGSIKHQHRTGVVKSINFDLQADTPLANDEFMHSSTRKQLFADVDFPVKEEILQGSDQKEPENLLFERLGVNKQISFFPYNLDKTQQVTQLNQRIIRQICTDIVSINQLGNRKTDAEMKKLKDLCSDEENPKKFICIPNFYEIST